MHPTCIKAGALIVALMLPACEGGDAGAGDTGADSGLASPDALDPLDPTAGGGSLRVDSISPGTSSDGAELSHASETPGRTDGPVERIFEQVDAGPLGQHALPLRDADVLGYGNGGAFIDADGDGDDDLFLGSPCDAAPVACVYRNDSTPGTIQFVRHEPWCFDTLPITTAGVAADLDGDGREELILGGIGTAAIVDFTSSEPEVVDLPPGPFFQADEVCAVGSILPWDADLDGDFELLFGCRFSWTDGGCRGIGVQGYSTGRNVVLDRVDGAWTPSSGAEVDPLLIADNTLAIAAIDANRDGVIDPALVSDTFSSVSRINTHFPPGGVFISDVGAADGRRAGLLGWGRGSDRWGSFMGIAQVADDAWFLTDWGRNRVARWSRAEQRFLQDAADPALNRQPDTDDPAFTWGAVADDLNGDGFTDLVVARGELPAIASDTWPTHNDFVLLGAEPGTDGAMRFLDAGEYSGFDGRASADAMGRSVAKVDLDGDGGLDLVFIPFVGAPTVWSSRGAQKFCTIEVRSRYVAAAGYGVAMRRVGSSVWNVRDIQGLHGFGGSVRILAPADIAALRFPSGAEMAVECDPGERLTVEEPEWLRVQHAGNLWEVRIAQDAVTAPEVDGAWQRVGAEVFWTEGTRVSPTLVRIAALPAGEFLVVGTRDRVVALRWFAPAE